MHAETATNVNGSSFSVPYRRREKLNNIRTSAKTAVIPIMIPMAAIMMPRPSNPAELKISRRREHCNSSNTQVQTSERSRQRDSQSHRRSTNNGVLRYFAIAG
jgi:hypothetical protein